MVSLRRDTSSRKGFTLAELLIALAILGVIATFTIPKVLQAQQSAESNAKAKEFIAMAVGAIDAYKLRNGGTLSSTTKSTDLTPYMNYVTIETTGTYDSLPGAGITLDCTAGGPCVRLHNGALGRLRSDGILGGTNSTYAFEFVFDPDGKLTDALTNNDGPGKSIQFWVYANGKVRTRGTIDADTHWDVNTYQPDATYDPSWFSWN